ncbi:hypothetical protein CDD82_5750 [Ophiocordyceps australis]|uniref:Zn(2)-C6 fungal-type domain-containing protein n=1 Tax=Ophiocordyceps australis TaxID=1399860 RepID=A0A2C5Z143_9HYPO|nr:hypothetical protein CDD82_5750 [Ophiocordyceps australis]
MSRDRNPQLRKLVAAEPTPSAQVELSTLPQASTSRRGNVLNSACETCRKRKAKCSGERPKCAYCHGKNIECIYNTAESPKSELSRVKKDHESLQRKYSTLQALFDALKELTSDAGSEVLKQIRQGADIESIMRLIHSNDLMQQTSLVPETRLRYNLLNMPLMPSRLQTADNDYLDCIVFDAAFPKSQSPGPPIHVSESLQKYQALYLRPFHSARINDARLQRIQLSKWTTVSADDELMRKLLHDYLLHEYPTFPVFQKDIFLDAAETGDQDLCSSLLANALLANACQCHEKLPPRPESRESASLGSLFLAEARRLLSLSDDAASLPTLQGCMLLHTALSNRGMNQIGYSYFNRAITMANKLGLFSEYREVNSRMQVARHFSAWCLFCWQA